MLCESSRAPHAVVLAVCFVVASACNRGPGDGSSAGASSGGPHVDQATAATVSGMAVFEGHPPANATLSMSSDPYCMRQARGEAIAEHSVVSPEGNVANVFVYVKQGLGRHSYEPPAGALVLNQHNCRFEPHVFGVRVGQAVEIVNDDETLHNVHAMPSANRDFNFGQPLKGMKRSQTFDRPEVMVPLKCDVHGWMSAYAGVLDHPYFAVTKSDGRFTIPGLPPGTYTIEAWHEKLGVRSQQVTLGPKASADVKFTFSAS